VKHDEPGWVKVTAEELEQYDDEELHRYAQGHAVEDLEWVLAVRVKYLMDEKARFVKRAKDAEQAVFDMDSLVTNQRQQIRDRDASIRDWTEAERTEHQYRVQMQQDKAALVAEIERRDSIEAELRAQLAEAVEEVEYLRRGGR
jgi:epoxyqueuosine reductase QueG